MHGRALSLALFALLCGCGDGEPEPAPRPFDGTVTFFVDPGEGTKDPGITKATTTLLAVEKADLTRLVDAQEDAAPKGSQYGQHTFPEGTTAAAIASHYGALLTKAGWKTPTDFHVADASIHFFDVRTLRAGADSPALQVTVAP